jgi:nucleoside-diphosphate-sugar epimerase
MILITGASGLVGQAIFKHFSKFYDCIGLAFSAFEKRFTHVDLTDAQETRRFFKGKEIDALIHCACIIPSKARRLPEQQVYKRNIAMLNNILTNIKTSAFFINISSCSIYNLRGSTRLTEKSNVLCDSSYQLSKSHIEEKLSLFYKGTNNLLNLRISSPYSIHKSNDSIIYKFINCALNENKIPIWGSGKRVQAFTNVDTLARAIRQLYSQKINGDFNYITSPSISMLALAKLIKRYLPHITIKKINRRDPEERCRSIIDITKISKYIRPQDSLEADIKRIINRLSK